MSFAIIYACYKLLENSSRSDESKPVVQQSYVHSKPIKGKKCSCNLLRKKFSNNHRGGYSL